MIRYDNNFDQIGMFETYSGEMTICDNAIIIPIYNAMLNGHPHSNENNGIVYLNLCFFVFNNVVMSSRDVFVQRSKHLEDPYLKLDYLNTNLNIQNRGEHLLELLDYQNNCQYWNWKIVSESFSLFIPDNYRIANSPFLIENINEDELKLLRNNDLKWLNE
jgi:hypothetical protein